MRRLLVLTAIAGALAGASTASASETKREALRDKIDQYIAQTRTMQQTMGVAITPSSCTYCRTNSLAYIRWVYRYWKRVNFVTSQRYRHPPHLAEFLCIHRYEGSWTDGGSPYWGGLQMDYGFQQTYGPHLLRSKGTADNWTMLEQVWTAEKAFRSRGFWPWPNTARYCGLL